MPEPTATTATMASRRHSASKSSNYIKAIIRGTLNRTDIQEMAQSLGSDKTRTASKATELASRQTKAHSCQWLAKQLRGHLLVKVLSETLFRVTSRSNCSPFSTARTRFRRLNKLETDCTYTRVSLVQGPSTARCMRPMRGLVCW